MSGDINVDVKRFSKDITVGPKSAPARSMFHAMGFSSEDLAKPLIGVASTWNEVTPLQLPLGSPGPEGEGRRSRSRGHAD